MMPSIRPASERLHTIGAREALTEARQKRQRLQSLGRRPDDLAKELGCEPSRQGVELKNSAQNASQSEGTGGMTANVLLQSGLRQVYAARCGCIFATRVGEITPEIANPAGQAGLAYSQEVCTRKTSSRWSGVETVRQAIWFITPGFASPKFLGQGTCALSQGLPPGAATPRRNEPCLRPRKPVASPVSQAGVQSHASAPMRNLFGGVRGQYNDQGPPCRFLS
jgi:hypothetical protein